MSFQGCILIFVGLVCLISAAPTVSNRQKRQTIYFEDELDERGSPKQGTSTEFKSGNYENHSRDTRAPAFGPEWSSPDFPHEHSRKGRQGSGHGFPKFGYADQDFKIGHTLHSESRSLLTSHGTPKISELVREPVEEPWDGDKKSPTNNQRLTVTGSWNQNHPDWNKFGDDENYDDGPNWDDWESWYGNDGHNNNGGAWNDNRKPSRNGGNNEAWNIGNQNWNGNWNQRPNGNGNGGARNGNQRPNGHRNFGNKVIPLNNNSPVGHYNGKIRPANALTGIRPPSTPRPNCDCPATEETNYVCGTDGNTYINPSLLFCAHVCGANVQMKHGGACTRTPAADLRWG